MTERTIKDLPSLTWRRLRLCWRKDEIHHRCDIDNAAVLAWLSAHRTQKQKNITLCPLHILNEFSDISLMWKLVDGFTISCVRWNYNFPGPHQHQMIWCPFLSMVPIRKKGIFSCASNFSVKGHLMCSICWYMSRHQAKKSVWMAGESQKDFLQNASHFFISIPNCPSGT